MCIHLVHKIHFLYGLPKNVKKGYALCGIERDALDKLARKHPKLDSGGVDYPVKHSSNEADKNRERI